MNEIDFYDLTDAMIEQLLPRMPQRFLNIYESMQIGGEYGYLFEGLVWVLVDDRIPVSAQERDQILQLAHYVSKNEEILAKLAGLTVESDDQSVER